jgi:hypothetical protein
MTQAIDRPGRRTSCLGLAGTVLRALALATLTVTADTTARGESDARSYACGGSNRSSGRRPL